MHKTSRIQIPNDPESVVPGMSLVRHAVSSRTSLHEHGNVNSLAPLGDIHASYWTINILTANEKIRGLMLGSLDSHHYNITHGVSNGVDYVHPNKSDDHRGSLEETNWHKFVEGLGLS